MRQPPFRTGKHPSVPGEQHSPDRPDKQPERVEQHTRLGKRADTSTPAPIADELLSASPRQVRLCVLCGGSLRAGQHLIRVHGSTIHARCSTTKRGSG